MKKFLPFILTAGMLIAACTFAGRLFAEPLRLDNPADGGASTATKEIPTPDFEEINASRGIEVILTDQSGKIRIEADEELMKWVVVEVQGDELLITIDKQHKTLGKQRVKVTVPVAKRTIRRLEASSAARITGPAAPLRTSDLLVKASSSAKVSAEVKAESCTADASSAAGIELVIEAPKCMFEASSAAKIEASIKAESCTAKASSAAGIELTGTSDYFEAESSSAAKVTARELASNRASVKASSGSGITVNCAEELEARASSGASVRYEGECRTTVTTSSGGSFRKL